MGWLQKSVPGSEPSEAVLLASDLRALLDQRRELVEALEAVDTARITDLPKDWLRATRLTDAALAKAKGASE